MRLSALALALAPAVFAADGTSLVVPRFVEDRSYQSEYEEKISAAAKAVGTATSAYAALVVGDDER
ncbi:MAG TPA: hypothetical protein PL196_01005, partial [Burkholderiaceae bacterium]|nr:hypothetical protein [Burkholderiaceae bacterium]